MAEHASQPAWSLAQASPRAAALAAELGLPGWLAQVLCGRGLAEPAGAREFLRPSLAGLPDFQGLKGLGRAVAVLAEAVEQGRTIGVAGDYDADGVTATALMVEFLRGAGARVVWELPHRLADGYGFTPPVARRLAAAGAQVALTVDCGVSDFAGVAAARELGLEVVVSDHHQMPAGPLVPAAAVINPQQEACGFCPHLAGVGVAFYLAAALRAGLDQRGWFSGRARPNLRESLDLVAVGTCADVVPLVDHNRLLVAEGLRVLNEGRRPGLAALAQAARLGRPWDGRDVSFGLAPRLNAAGRLDSPGPALELLLTRRPERARELAAVLEGLNRQRRQVEQEIFAAAAGRVEENPELSQAPCLVVAGQGWHRGVLGIVASRLVERFGRPALVFGIENGSATGSGRSVEGFHLQKALAGQAGLLTAFGGHAAAAGATLPTDRLPELARGLCRAAAQTPGLGEPAPLVLEAQASLAELGPAACGPLESLGPFGPGNPEPVVGAFGVLARKVRVVGQNHLKLELADPAGGPVVPAIGFGLAGLAPAEGAAVDVAASPRVSTYGGRHLELVVSGLRPAAD
jgi:single-stranded-DNA-specific exonuclease